MFVEVKHLLAIFLLFISIVGNCQVKKPLAFNRFNQMRFKEGIYINHKQLLTNKPIPIKYLITSYDKTEFDFFNKLLAEESIVYFDRFGLKKEIKVEDLWGFCRRGSIYINLGDDFNRIPVMGSICHFVASVTTYEDPYYGIPYSYGYNFSYGTPTSNPRTDLYQFIMDFNSGKVMEFTSENVKIMLVQDAELYEEFDALRKKKQKQLKFLYIRKYNEKHPLTIPVNEP